MGKNVTIYIPTAVAGKMKAFSEVNWSEVCRKAIVDYIETRSQIDLAPILEKLKKERHQNLKQGQLVMYTKIIPKMAWEDFEFLYPRLNKVLIKEEPTAMKLPGEQPVSDESAEQIAIYQMRRWLRRFVKEHDVSIPEDISDAYAEGAIKAFMDVYNRIKQQQ